MFIIYFRVGFLIVLFTYVNLYLLVLLFILSFIVLYGGNKGGGGGYFVLNVLKLTGCTRIFGEGREPGRDREVLASTT